MERLRAAGMVEALRRSCQAGRPLLGICLGLQLLFEASEEGQAQGLGLLGGRVRALPPVAGPPHPPHGLGTADPRHPQPLAARRAPRRGVGVFRALLSPLSRP